MEVIKIEKIGEVIHYYDKIGVAIIRLEKDLKLNDKIKFVNDDHEFEQEVQSMQVEHVQIDSAKSGDEIGVKINEKVKAGTEVFR